MSKNNVKYNYKEDEDLIEHWKTHYNNLSKEVFKLTKDKVSNYEDYNEIPTVEVEDQLIDSSAEYSLRVMSEISVYDYLYVLEYCKRNNIKAIVDIGVAHGYQSDIFLENNIEYVGINDEVGEQLRNYKNNKVKYIKGFYPFIEDEKEYLDRIKNNNNNKSNKENTLGVALLSLGWRMFVGDDKDLIYKQFERLSKEFSKSLVSISPNIVPIIKPLFKEVNNLGEETERYITFYELIS